MREADDRSAPAKPVASPIQEYLEHLYTACRTREDGEVATYIPALAGADPAWFGISLVTADGFAYGIGDTARAFTIQSISKPILYGLALQTVGVDDMLERVGVEPTGDRFNSIAVDEESRRPFNPMVNAGAIVTTGVVVEHEPDPWARVAAVLGAFVGHEVAVDEDVFESERATGDRNRAIGYLMRDVGRLSCDVDRVLDLYFRQCSVTVTCHDLALAAATLANGGLNPVTEARALDESQVTRVLSVMETCGMYDYAGSWAYTVGLPAKSGVSGGILAVLPGRLGIGVYSPRLDARGNSVRGVEVCRRLADDLHLHPLRVRPAAADVVRAQARGDRRRSTRVRPPREDERLDREGRRFVVHELQGDLDFAGAEALSRAVLADLEGVDLVVLCGARLGAVDAPSRRLLDSLSRSLDTGGRTLVVAGFPDGIDVGGPHRRLGDLDDALEWCENQVLGSASTPGVGAVSALEDQQLLRGFDRAEFDAVAGVATIREFDAGQVVLREGDVADSLCFILAGRMSVRLGQDGGTSRRVAAFGAGVAVGDGALVAGSRRSADVVADERCVAAVVTVDDLAGLQPRHPGLLAKLYANLARVLSERLGRANAQLRMTRE